MNRVDRLRAVVYTALSLALCGIVSAVAWVIEQAIKAHGQWVLDHADAIVAVVLTVCIVLLAVMAVAERARKDNPSW